MASQIYSISKFYSYKAHEFAYLDPTKYIITPVPTTVKIVKRDDKYLYIVDVNGELQETFGEFHEEMQQSMAPLKFTPVEDVLFIEMTNMAPLFEETGKPLVIADLPWKGSCLVAFKTLRVTKLKGSFDCRVKYEIEQLKAFTNSNKSKPDPSICFL
jgi:hypothetical protein